MDTPKSRILVWALEIVGSEEALAETLHSDAEMLALWMSGEAVLPITEFVAAANIVANRQADTEPEPEHFF
jgi:hypothetical protein